MIENNGNDRAAYAAVDDALYTYPIEAAPPGILHSVMRRVEVMPAASRFRLPWLDFALSLFFTGMAGLGFILWQTISLPPYLVPWLRTRLLYIWQHFRYGPESAYVFPVLAVSLVLGVLMLFFFSSIANNRFHIRGLRV
jgi:hypothetical protein